MAGGVMEGHIKIIAGIYGVYIIVGGVTFKWNG